MSLTPGTRLGSYQIQSVLGAGGMGQVYRARDTKLNRDVAVKVVADDFLHDPERLARFRREAQLLAALNHPNIAAIYGLEEAQGSQFLVMELVDGETLAERIRRPEGLRLPADGILNDGSGRPSGLPIDQALAIARQVADALQAAHEKGIVHRDLKPANIALTTEGNVKVLDFGLGKLIEPGSGIGDRGSGGAATDHAATHSPTLSLAATHAGVILGTAAYMSPEQARGKPTDKRTDVWAFGCVLYEMLTGIRAFDGEDASETMAFVMAREPDWSALPADTPPAIRTLLRRCLDKDRHRRAADIAVALFAIEASANLGAVSGHDSPTSQRSGTFAVRRIVLFGTAMLLGAMVATGAFWIAGRANPPRPVRTEIATSGEAALTLSNAGLSLAITPDGSRIVYRGATGLFVRALAELEPAILEGATAATSLFVSPDGQWVGFFDERNAIRKVPITGGPSVPVAPSTFNGPRGATWGQEGTII